MKEGASCGDLNGSCTAAACRRLRNVDQMAGLPAACQLSAEDISPPFGGGMRGLELGEGRERSSLGFGTSPAKPEPLLELSVMELRARNGTGVRTGGRLQSRTSWCDITLRAVVDLAGLEAFAAGIEVQTEFDRVDAMRPAWQRDAACREPHPGATFFPGPGESAAPAIAICARCLVREQCLEYAIANRCHGIWAGTAQWERAKLRHRRRRRLDAKPGVDR